MILKTDYQRGGLGDLLEYMQRDKGEKVPLEDLRGRELDKEDVEALIEKSEEHGIERHIIISPHPGASHSTHEIARDTRLTMRDWQSGRSSVQFAYAVHGEHHTPHSHVAVTGRERDLWMDGDDIQQLRETARESFREAERLPEREQEATADTRSREQSPAFLNTEVEAEPEPELEPEPEPEPTGSSGGGR